MSYEESFRPLALEAEDLNITIGEEVTHQKLKSNPCKRGVEKLSYPYNYTDKEMLSIKENLRKAITIQDVNPKFENESKRRDFFRFKQLLLFYKERVENPVFTAEYIMEKNLLEGAAFAATLKDYYKYSVRRTISISPEESYENYPTLIGDINEVFPSECLLKLENPDTKDYLLMTKPPPIVKESLINEIKAEFAEILSGLPPINKRDMLNDFDFFRNSKSYDSYSCKAVKNFDYFLTNGLSTKSVNELTFKRSFVYKLPGESRDALEADTESLQVLLPAFKYMSLIFNNIEEYKMKRGFDSYQELAKLKKKIFIMVDMKKCGLTFPRPIFLALLEVLIEAYDIQEFKNIYSCYKKNPKIILEDGSIIRMTNGVGLGMFNELVTIGLLLVYKLAKKKQILPSESKGWFFNDDQLLFWDEKENPFQPNNPFFKYIKLYSKLGFIVHSEKPLIANTGIFCEQYSKSSFYTEKSIKQMHILLSCITMGDIYSAKCNFANHYKKWWGLTPQENDWALLVVSSFWGYEFSKKEIYLPLEYGGWIREQDRGLNTYLEYLFDSNIKDCFKKLVLFFKEFKPKYKPWRKPTRVMKALSNMKVEDKGIGIFNWNERIDQILSRDIIPGKQIDSLDLIKIKKNIENRQKAFFSSKKINNRMIYDFLNSRNFNNCKVPSSLIEVCHKVNFNLLTIPKLDKPSKCDDILRLVYFIQTKGEAVNPPSKGVPADILREFLKNYKRAFKDKENHNDILFLKLLPKIIKFGNNCPLIFNRILEDYPNAINLHCENDSSFTNMIENITGHTLKEKELVIPYANNIFIVNIRDLDETLFGRESKKKEEENFRSILLKSYDSQKFDCLKNYTSSEIIKFLKEETENYWQSIFSKYTENKSFKNKLSVEKKKENFEEIFPLELPTENYRIFTEEEIANFNISIGIGQIAKQMQMLLPSELREEIFQEEIQTYTLSEMNIDSNQENEWSEDAMASLDSMFT